MLLLAAKLTEVGLVVLQPLCEALPFDLALFHSGQFYRLQVKRAQREKRAGERYSIPLRKVTVNSRGPKVYRYSKQHADFICGVVMQTGDVYMFPVEDIEHLRSTITVDPHGNSNSVQAKKSRKIDSEAYRNSIKLGRQRLRL